MYDAQYQERNVPQKALITGITGQTGSFLAQHLVRAGYEVHGTTRSLETTPWRLAHLGIAGQVQLHPLNAMDFREIDDIIARNFDYIFHLAAESSVATSLKEPTKTVTANVTQTTAWLEAVKNASPDCRFFNAVTSEVLTASNGPLGEDAPCSASNPYAVTKLASMNMAQVFRESFDLYVVNGLLFNHESELRDARFVTGKIILNLCNLVNDTSAPAFQLGNVLAERDFSHAEDFARGIASSLNHETSQDYVYASGTLRSVKDFFDVAACQLGFDPNWTGEGTDMVCRDLKSGRELVTINPEFYRPIDEKGKVGNPARAQSDLDWQPQITFAQLIERMIAFHMNKT